MDAQLSNCFNEFLVSSTQTKSSMNKLKYDENKREFDENKKNNLIFNKKQTVLFNPFLFTGRSL